MFSYEFMINAFIVGILLSIIIPLLGTNMVLKNLSMTGDTLSHTALCGVAVGLCAGFNPLITAIIISVIAAFAIELIRKKLPRYADTALTIVFATAVGITGILSSYTSSANFSAYLFGSIVLIDNAEIILIITLTALVLLFFGIFYKQILAVAFNEQQAKIAGVKVGLINAFMTLFLSVTVAVASKTIGALIISSLLVVPVAASLLISKSYKNTLLVSIIFSFFSMVIGLTTSYYLNLKPGATIVLIAVFFFVTAYLTTSSKKTYLQKKLASLSCSRHDK